ncbi:unnamed protein product [Urochloa humidicola]
MKVVVEELVDCIGELTGVGRITKLIKLIIKKASAARKQNRVCRKFARWLEMMEGLLKPLLKVPKLMEHPEARAPLKHLEESLHQAYLLVIKYKDRSYPYRFIMGSDIAERFDDMRNEIKDCIDLIPLIMLFVDQTITHRVDTRSQKGKNKGEKMDMKKRKNKEEGKKNKDEEMDQKKGKNKGERKNREEEMQLKEEGKNREEEMNLKKGKNREEEMDLKKGKNKEEGKNKDNQKVNKEKGKDKMKDMEKEKGRDKGKGNKQNGEEKGRGEAGNHTEKGREENEKKKKNAPPLVEMAVLKVAMRCECKGCPGRINHSICKYPGVEKVVKMKLDEGIASLTVVGHFDAKMLRDYVAKDTKKEVELADNSGREREDHQVLEKTDHSKSIGGGKGSPRKKKRVVPMMVAATVVLKVGDTGIRCECNGCVDKICDTLFKITGVQKVGIDTDRNQVTVTGTNMDIKNLQEKLGKKVRRPVEVI